MAKMTKEHKSESSERQPARAERATGVGSPISNDAYNVISALHAKLEGLEAYRKYAKDGDSELWRTLTRTELEGVEHLIDELERLVRDDRFRMKEPGRANA